MKRISIIILICVYSFVNFAIAQTRRPKELRKAYVNPAEIVSIVKTTPFNQALEVLNIPNKKFLKKVIIDPEERVTPIGVDIEKEHWLDALEIILRTNKLWYEEYPDYMKIVSVDESTANAENKQNSIDFSTREVVISAIFFEADGSRLRQLGMSWDLFRGNDVNLGMNMSAAETKTSLAEIVLSPNLNFGNLIATFKTMESDQVGEIVASPQITVRSKQEGRIQVGKDIAVTIKDFAGNSVTQFFSTGSIIRVTPEVIKHDSVYFIHLNLDVERSNSSTSTTGLEIKKSAAKTSVLLLDGEETVIGGLYVNEETNTREGVPLLKDLPWWFFGIRYLFGFDTKSVIKKELIILLKAELLPTLEERLARKMKHLGEQSKTFEMLKEFQEKIKSHQEKQNKD